MNGKPPFPQFDDGAFEGDTVEVAAGSLVRAIIAWDETYQADKPHIVLIYDPEVKSLRAIGPYATGYEANVAAVETEEDINDPKNNDGVKVLVYVVPLEGK